MRNHLRLQTSPEQVASNIALAKAQTADRIQKNASAGIAKGFTLPQSTSEGLALFPISPELQIEYSVKTPLKNAIPRRNVTGGIGYGYKVIRNLDVSGVSGKVEDGRRARFINTQVEEMPFLFVTSGFENFATFDSQFASENMDSQSQAIAIVQKTLTEMLAVDEEKKIIGGNRKALGEIVSITATANTETAGSLTAGDVSVIAVPLTLYGLNQSSLAKGVRLTHNEQNADGSVTRIVGGYGVKKTIASAVTVEAGNSLDILVQDVPDAVGYAVFAGVAGSERLVYVGPSNSFNLKAISTDSQLASDLASNDQSADLLDYDGFFGLAGREGGVVISLDGKALEAEGTFLDSFEEVIGSIADRDATVTHMVMSRKTYTAYYKAIASKIVNINLGNGAPVVANFGGKPVDYTSSNLANAVQFLIDEYMPDGSILFVSIGSAPAQLGILGNLVEISTQEDFAMIAWPLVTRSYQFGIYCRAVLAHKYPSSIGLLKNIKI